MPQEHFYLTGRAVLLAAIAAAYPVPGFSAPAAQVDFAVGDVTAVGPEGQSRTLGKGAQIEQGDTVNTNGGRAQLRFTDGAYVSLQPQSQFRIDQYRFDGKTDGNEKGFFSLLKGGLRTITGLVGRSNKANYQVSTSVATIGIRGTEYTIQYGQSITGTVGEGEINVCNGAGCLSVTNGESYYVQDQDVKPVLTDKRTDLPPPEPAQPPSNFVSAANRNADGSFSVLTNPLVGTIPGLQVAFSSPSNLNAISRVQATVNSSGAVSSFVIGPSSESAEDRSITLGSVTLGTPSGGGNDGIIAWGVALGGAQHNVDSSICCLSAGEAFHFVLGFPTLDSDLAFLAMNHVVGTYSFLGATTPTSFGTAVGNVTGGSLTANFGSGSLSTSFNIAINRDSGGTPLSSPL
ncbi:MAG: FecR family protein, partial [Betaproteobacteria bacterium]